MKQLKNGLTHVVPNLYDVLSALEHQRRSGAEYLECIFFCTLKKDRVTTDCQAQKK